MPRTLVLVTTAALVALTTLPADAQRFELTPFVGYQFGGELAEIGQDVVELDLDESTTWGIVFNADVTASDQVELFYSNQDTELVTGTPSSPRVGVETLHVGAIHEYGRRRPLSPYVGLGLGATRFDVRNKSDTRFSGAVSVGLKMIVSDHLGFRFDGRITGISTGSDPIGCTDEGCIGYPDTSILWQYSLNAGVILHIGR